MSGDSSSPRLLPPLRRYPRTKPQRKEPFHGETATSASGRCEPVRNVTQDLFGTRILSTFPDSPTERSARTGHRLAKDRSGWSRTGWRPQPTARGVGRHRQLPEVQRFEIILHKHPRLILSAEPSGRSRGVHLGETGLL